MTTSTLALDRAAWREAVAAIAATAHAKLPACAGRIDSAIKLVLAGDVELLPEGGAMVASRTHAGTEYVVVNGRCECPDFARAPGNLCAHRLAYGIVRRANELLPRQEPAQVSGQQGAQNTGHPAQEVGQQALPEAPASVNVRLTIDGREVQWTLRDHDEARLATRLEALLARYPVTQPPAQRASIAEGWCSKHGLQMTQTHKDGRSWWSHKTATGWCKGR